MNIDYIKIEEAVKKAEEKTSGEIVPVIVKSSDAYSGEVWCWAFGFSLLLMWVIYFLVPSFPSYVYFLFEVPAVVLGLFLFNIPWLKRKILTPKIVAEEVYQKALEAFHASGLSQTRDRNGILIFVSLLEHRVQILADNGIHAKISQDVWEKVIQEFRRDIRGGQFTEGFVRAIETCGKLLAEHFPKKPDDTNELSDKLTIIEG